MFGFVVKDIRCCFALNYLIAEMNLLLWIFNEAKKSEVSTGRLYYIRNELQVHT